MTHHLKTWPEFYKLIKGGKKKFELRYNDRNFQTGDILILEELDPHLEAYTGKSITVVAEFILEYWSDGLEPGWCIISIS